MYSQKIYWGLVLANEPEDAEGEEVLVEIIVQSPILGRDGNVLSLDVESALLGVQSWNIRPYPVVAKGVYDLFSCESVRIDNPELRVRSVMVGDSDLSQWAEYTPYGN